MEQKRIAVIGAGPSGLTAIKACKEEDVEAVCFERTGEPGGVWRYRDEDTEGVASVMKTTTMNTSKEMSAFSDFPPPKEFPNYMRNTLMFKYLMMYAKNFDLLKHIRYHQEVIKVEKSDDYEETGCWTVTAKDTKTGDVTRENFQGVMICIGHNAYPKVPTLPGQEKFKGKIMHSHSLKSCQKFSGMNVVVVGIGNSGADAAVDSTFVANQVYLSTRRGTWVASTVGPEGYPSDIAGLTRYRLLMQKFRSFDSICTDVEVSLNNNFNHEAYNLKPKHRVLSASATINDHLPSCILSGKVIIKNNITRFEDHAVLFESDHDVTPADVVIFATGYHIKFPFLSEDVWKTKENRIFLYKYALPTSLKHPTLILTSLVRPRGAFLPVFEIQCRWFMQIFKRKLKLPPQEVMEEEIKYKDEINAKRFEQTESHIIQVDFIPYLDELAEQIGVKPNIWKLALTDYMLFRECFFGPVLPYQYRLWGPHKWEGARDAIITARERIFAPLNTAGRNKKVEKQIHASYVMKKFLHMHLLFWIIVILIAAVFLQSIL